MKATLLVRNRIVYSKSAFAELVLWLLPASIEGSTHQFKYRLAYIVDGICVVRYDNERKKGNHRHFGEEEFAYTFVSPEQLVADFEKDIERWNSENSST
jgi:hypothetical protein